MRPHSTLIQEISLPDLVYKYRLHSPNDCYIYTLRDPVTGAVRYVGQSVAPRGRLTQHLKVPTSPAMSAWFGELAALSLSPLMVIVDQVPSSRHRQWFAVECSWVAYYVLECGCDLLNNG